MFKPAIVSVQRHGYCSPEMLASVQKPPIGHRGDAQEVERCIIGGDVTLLVRNLERLLGEYDRGAMCDARLFHTSVPKRW